MKTSRHCLLVRASLILSFVWSPASVTAESVNRPQNQSAVNTWSQVTSPTNHTLRAVQMLSSTNGWAIGDAGTILHWNGHSWSAFDSPTNADLVGMDFASPTAGWIVGGYDAGPSTLLRWSGETWTSIASPVADSIMAIDMLTENEGWAVGTNSILRWNGQFWATVPLPSVGADFTFEAIAMVSPTDGWIGALSVQGTGFFLRWNGTSWSRWTSVVPVGVSAIFDLQLLSPTFGWSVGISGTLRQWDGSVWRTYVSPTQTELDSVSLASNTHGWAVGLQGTIVQWNGSVWALAASPTSAWLHGVSHVPGTDGREAWAVGADGVLLHYNMGCATSPPVDLSIERVLPIQVLDGQPLVANKPTALRIDLRKSGAGAACDVRLAVTNGSQTIDRIWVLEDSNIDTHRKLISDNVLYPLNFAAGEDTKTIYVFGSELTPTHEPYIVQVYVDPQNAIVETSELNNGGSVGPLAVYVDAWTDQGGDALDVQYLLTDWDDAPYTQFQSFYQSANGFLAAVLPISKPHFAPRVSTLMFGNTALYRGFDGRLDKDELVRWALQAKKVLTLAHPESDRYIAVVPNGWFARQTNLGNILGTSPVGLGLVIVEARVGDQLNGGGTGPQLVAHELGHTFGLPFPRADPDCGEEYLECNITRANDIGDLAGSGLWVTENLVISPEGEDPDYCFMSNALAPRVWIDTHDYIKLLSDHTSLGLSTLDAATAEPQAILASGIASASSGRVTLDAWYVVPGLRATTPLPGPYVLEYLGSAGEVLEQVSFSLTFTWDGDTLSEVPFVHAIPYVANTAQIIVLHNGIEVGRKVVSEHSPIVLLDSPDAGARLSGAANITWAGSDADGDPLIYSVLVSADHGATWEMLVDGLTQATFTWDLTGIPAGSAYRIKIVATDGFNTGLDVSYQDFSIEGRTYLPLIRH